MTNLITIDLDQIAFSSFRHGLAVPVPSPAMLTLARDQGIDALPRMRVRPLLGGYELVWGIQTFLVANTLQAFTHTTVECTELRDNEARQQVALDYRCAAPATAMNPIELGQLIRDQAQHLKQRYTQVGKQYGLTSKEASAYVRLTRLCPSVQAQVAEGALSPNAARLLVTLAPHEQQSLASKTIDKSWTVRQLEVAVRELRSGTTGAPVEIPVATPRHAEHMAEEERLLTDAIGCPVEVLYEAVSHHGVIVIRFIGNDVYDGISQRLLTPPGLAAVIRDDF